MPREKLGIRRHDHPLDLALQPLPQLRVLLAQLGGMMKRFDIVERILKLEETILVLPLFSSAFHRSNTSLDRANRAR